ncbi:hypothetical protein ABM34_06245 [Companilactobacillus ginsenosidimutans]|uniref:site-specific DNA-methyltransferase (adenine-specific) n=1 Tax=Companilactobacillus ginsenosidimutans TaxID=1007676 RepID=A0A0H4R0C8_9LACO|nr:hypothetical protein ABM34_06245 [Companilactobacillus ginsenosidimutans]
MFTPSYHDGVIKDLIDDVSVDDFNVDVGGQVEIIGWLYQYYNTEPKDRAFKKKKYSESDIPAVTQLFTPDWIVKYMVENSLGRYWINVLQAKGNKSSEADVAKQFNWKYFMPSAEQQSEEYINIQSNSKLQNTKPEDLTLIDPAMGSGHVLVYSFEVLMDIYESEGYSKREAATNILEKNLYGLDIDTRAFQLSYFALMMKGRQYNRRILNNDLKLNVYDIPELSEDSVDSFISHLPSNVEPTFSNLLKHYENGNEYGSLIKFDNVIDWEVVNPEVNNTSENQQMTFDDVDSIKNTGQLQDAINVSKLLTSKFTIGITNPPYMGSGKMDQVLSKYVKKYFKEGKADLFGAFMQRMAQLVEENGYYAMVTQHSWMFLSSFEDLRKELKNNALINMAHLGTRAFEEIGGEVVQSTAFVYQNTKVTNYVGTYERLIDFPSQQKKETAFLEAVNNPKSKYLYRTNQANFEKIPGMPIAYWASDELLNLYGSTETVEDVADVKKGSFTGDNSRFLRLWPEVSFSKVKFNCEDVTESIKSHKKWFPYNKGGSFRKWYGNHDYLINWFNDAAELKNFPKFGLRNPQYIFQEGLTWSSLSSGNPSFRYSENGFVFDSKGPMIFSKNLPYLLSLLNSVISTYILNILSPTLDYNPTAIRKIPYLFNRQFEKVIFKLSTDNILISKNDYNSNEWSWDFLRLPLLIHIADENLSLPNKILVELTNCAKIVAIYSQWREI